jgi:hypothetical protein
VHAFGFFPFVVPEESRSAVSKSSGERPQPFDWAHLSFVGTISVFWPVLRKSHHQELRIAV